MFPLTALFQKYKRHNWSRYRFNFNVQELADKVGFNYSYLCSLFKKYKYISPNEYIIEK